MLKTLAFCFQDEDSEAVLAADFEIGHFIRERIVPRAVLYFTGEAIEDDDDDVSICLQYHVLSTSCLTILLYYCYILDFVMVQIGLPFESMCIYNFMLFFFQYDEEGEEADDEVKVVTVLKNIITYTACMV